MSNKFEQLLELLINEENDKAEQLFHEIVVEKSRDIYEGLAETTEETVEETKKEEATSEEKVEETAKEEAVAKEGEEVEIEEQSKEATEEESIEEVGGDATDELVKDISAEENGDAEMAGDEANGDEEAGEEGDTEERVADLEDALEELKAEFEKMLSGKGDEEEAEETVIQPAVANAEAQAMEAKEATKETVKEYKIQKSADNSDKSDKSAKSPVKDAGTKMGDGAKNIAQGGEEKGRSAPTAEKMGEFENTGGKDKSTSFKKEVKADTADHSDKSAKSPVAKK